MPATLTLTCWCSKLFTKLCHRWNKRKEYLPEPLSIRPFGGSESSQRMNEQHWTNRRGPPLTSCCPSSGCIGYRTTWETSWRMVSAIPLHPPVPKRCQPVSCSQNSSLGGVLRVAVDLSMPIGQSRKSHVFACTCSFPRITHLSLAPTPKSSTFGGKGMSFTCLLCIVRRLCDCVAASESSLSFCLVQGI